jgi:hypothetical protein
LQPAIAACRLAQHRALYKGNNDHQLEHISVYYNEIGANKYVRRAVSRQRPLVDVSMVDSSPKSNDVTPTGQVNLNDSKRGRDPGYSNWCWRRHSPGLHRSTRRNGCTHSLDIRLIKHIQLISRLSSTATLTTDTAIPLVISPPSPPERESDDLPWSIPPSALSSFHETQMHLRPDKTFFLDPRPVSIDLQSSFIQCPETSFDLLNDTVSFFGRKGEDVMDGDEDRVPARVVH